MGNKLRDCDDICARFILLRKLDKKGRDEILREIEVPGLGRFSPSSSVSFCSTL
jgi:hypothetical protein